MRTVRQLLEAKPAQLHAIAPAAPVIEAIRAMADHGIGALLVMDGPRLAGIVSKAMHDPARLADMAANARKAGKPDAARLLASMVEAIAGGKTIAQFKGERP